MKFNINEYVKVRLTSAGYAVYIRDIRERNAELAKFGIILELGEERPEDSEGYTQWQLWELMSIFGPHISHGSNPMFDTEIIIPEKYLTPGE